MPQPANNAAPIEPVAVRLLAEAEGLADCFSAAIVMVTAIQAAETPEVRHMIALRLMRFMKTNLHRDDVEIVVQRIM